MSKHIIKNCPSFCRDLCSADDTDCFCCNETNCVLKQIVELCKNKDYFVKKVPYAQFSSGVQNSELAFDILQLLGVQEVE